MKIVCIFVFLLGLVLSMDTAKAKWSRYPLSCSDLEPSEVSGVYKIQPKGACNPITVYCEMARTVANGRAFTFLPRSFTRRPDAQKIINSLFTDRKNVLLKLQKKNNRSEAYTLIQPHSSYSNYTVQILVSHFTGYTRPYNYFMKEYIFLGILPATVLRRRSVQGFRSNGKTVQFRNCDSNPNSFFALMPNHDHVDPSNYHNDLSYETRGVAVDWRATAKPITNPDRTMPNDFFFFTEVTFGGCGCYTSSDRWNKYGYHATAIGIR